MGRSILVKWTNPYAVQELSHKRGELSWLTFPIKQPCYFWLLQVSVVYCYSKIYFLFDLLVRIPKLSGFLTLLIAIWSWQCKNVTFQVDADLVSFVAMFCLQSFQMRLKLKTISMPKRKQIYQLEQWEFPRWKIIITR